jgi:hypothetical protein
MLQSQKSKVSKKPALTAQPCDPDLSCRSSAISANTPDTLTQPPCRAARSIVSCRNSWCTARGMRIAVVMKSPGTSRPL